MLRQEDLPGREKGPAPVTPGLRLTCAPDTFIALGQGNITVPAAVASKRLIIETEVETDRRYFELFTLPDDAVSSAGHRG
ncbi:hypothetical protein [Streptomyces sp. NPDC088847]|uniref:hypothetical protein n=1 Tax=Streptomyces sp. NPDC088847 TaxID=3365909 RepID=UPI00380DB074